MARHLGEKFIAAFEDGILKPVLCLVKRDPELDFEIRRQEVHIYYCGGKILGIRPTRRSGQYCITFDKNYLMGESSLPSLPELVATPEDVTMWVQSVDILKARMDTFFLRHPKTERKLQQCLIRMNSIVSDVHPLDFLVTDIEYGKVVETQKGKKIARFDLVGLYLGTDAKLGNSPRLVIFELKHGDGALTAKAGMQQHLEDMLAFVETHGAAAELAHDVISHITVKRRLGLLRDSVALDRLDADVLEKKPIFAFIFAGHNKKSTILHRELKYCTSCQTHVNLCQAADVLYCMHGAKGDRILSRDLKLCDEIIALVAEQLGS